MAKKGANVGRSLYQQLEDYYSGNTKELKRIIDDLNIVYGYGQNGKMQAKLTKTYDSETSTTFRRNFYNWVSILHFMFNIPLEAFHLPSEWVFNTHLIDRQRNHFELHQLKEFESSNEPQKEMVKKYFDASEKFLSYLKKSFYVYDYLDWFSNKDHTNTEKYLEVHDKIFLEIETFLKQKKEAFTYARFLALPKRLFPDTEKYNIPEDQIVHEVINRLPLPLFSHVCRCLKDFPIFEESDYLEDGIDLRHGGFYLLANPTREYLYSIVNEGEFILSEYYRYNRSGKGKPDLLFIQDHKGKLSDLANIYRKEFFKFFSKERPKLTVKSIKSVMDTYQTRLENIEDEMKELKAREEDTPSRVKSEQLFREKESLTNKVDLFQRVFKQ